MLLRIGIFISTEGSRAVRVRECLGRYTAGVEDGEGSHKPSWPLDAGKHKGREFS